MATIIYATGKPTVLADPANGVWKALKSNAEVDLLTRACGYRRHGVTPQEWDNLEAIAKR